VTVTQQCRHLVSQNFRVPKEREVQPLQRNAIHHAVSVSVKATQHPIPCVRSQPFRNATPHDACACVRACVRVCVCVCVYQWSDLPCVHARSNVPSGSIPPHQWEHQSHFHDFSCNGNLIINTASHHGISCFFDSPHLLAIDLVAFPCPGFTLTAHAHTHTHSLPPPPRQPRAQDHSDLQLLGVSI
jgi:hypothetical protein